MFTIVRKETLKELQAKEALHEAKLNALVERLGLRFYNGAKKKPHYRGIKTINGK